MKRFSIIVLLLLLVSLPLKLSYFRDSASSEAELVARQEQASKIASHLVLQEFEVTSPPDDPFLPTVELRKDSCILLITPLPVINDLDDTFTYLNGTFDGSLSYYYDGEIFTDAPKYRPKFWEYAIRALPTIGIKLRPRIRLGIAHSDGCNLQELLFEN